MSLRHLAHACSCFALLMLTVNYWVIKTMSKAKHEQSKSMSKTKALLTLALLCFACLRVNFSTSENKKNNFDLS